MEEDEWWQAAPVVEGAGTSKDDKAPTEGERKAAFLATRLAGGVGMLREFGTAGQNPEMLPSMVRGVLGEAPANLLTSSDRQRFEAAQEDMLDAALTLGTGAAYNKEQLTGYRKAYFPQIGDNPEVIADKRRRLELLLNAARIGAGSAAPQIDNALKQSGFRVFDPRDTEIAFKDEAKAPTGYRLTPAQEGQVGAAVQAGDEGAALKLLEQFSGNPPTDETRKSVRAAIESAKRGGKTEFNYGAVDKAAQAAADLERFGPHLAQAMQERQGQSLDPAVRGMADAMSLGFADEIAAGGNWLAGQGDYSELLKRERAIDAADERLNFIPRFAGQLGGGTLLPVSRGASPGRLAAEGAAYGGVYGAGSAEGGLPGERGSAMDRLPAAAAGAGIGGTVGFFGGKLLDKLSGLPVRGERNLEKSITSGTGAGAKVARAKRFGVDLPLGASGRRGDAILDNTLSNTVGAATPMNDARIRAAEQVGKAVDDVARTYGPGSDFVGMGEALQRGAKSWISKFEETSSKVYDRLPISDKAPADLAATRDMLGKVNSRFAENPELGEALKDARLTRYMDALAENGPGLNWQMLKDFRSRIGEEIGEQRFSDGSLKSDLRGLYAALSDDMRATAAAQGPLALRAFERANNLYREGQQRIDTALLALLGDDGRKSAESAAQRLMTMARSGKGSSDIKRLSDIRASMPPDEWGEVSSSLIKLLGQPANSEGREFSAQTFIRNFDDMSEGAKNLLFGDRGRKELRENLQQFAGVVRDLAGRDALRNTSNTAPQMINSNIITTMLKAIPNAAAARVWTNPRFVQWATGAARMEQGAARAAGRPNVGKQIALLDKVAASQPSIAQDLFGLRQSLLGLAGQESGN